ncbi:MAG TPA: phage portal protein [Rectinema sp.]|nr:phage portal protein [Rectinema sp.]
MKESIFDKIIKILAKLFGIKSIPPEITSGDADMLAWWDIYRNRPNWLSQDYVSTDGIKRRRDRMNLGVAKMICSEIAGLVLAEEPEVIASELVKKVIDNESLWDNLRRSIEYQAALGAQVIKVGVSNQSGAPRVWLDFVKALNFIPLSWDNTQITEGVFLDKRLIAAKPYIRIETHKRDVVDGVQGYSITNKLYNEETQLEASLDILDEKIEPQIFLPISRPIFAYIKNPEANNINPESPTGISVFANGVSVLRALDVAFDQFYSDVELGGRRVALPGSVFRKYTEVDEDGNARRVSFFDPSDRLFIRLQGDDADAFTPQDLTFDIRADQFKATIQTMLDLLSMIIGFDAGYFTFDGTSVATATEVVSRNSHTYKTMVAFRENLDNGLRYIFSIIDELGRMYSVAGAGDGNASLAWDDSVIEDRNTRANYYVNLYQNQLIDLVTALEKIHGYDEKTAQEMAARIKADKPTIDTERLFGAGI